MLQLPTKTFRYKTKLLFYTYRVRAQKHNAYTTDAKATAIDLPTRVMDASDDGPEGVVVPSSVAGFSVGQV
jgi:hypothetical protein